MKNRLFNEVKKEAPFRKALKDEIIENALKTKNSSRFKIRFALTSVTIALIAFLAFNIPNINLSNHDAASISSGLNQDNKQLIESIEQVEYENHIYMLTREQQGFLKQLYNSTGWEDVGKEKLPAEMLTLYAIVSNGVDYQAINISFTDLENSKAVYSDKGKIHLSNNETLQFNQILADALNGAKQKPIVGIEGYQHENLWYQDQPEIVERFKSILLTARFSSNREDIKLSKPDGTIYLTYAISSGNSLHYWVYSDHILLELNNELGVLSGNAMYEFLVHLAEDGVEIPWTREITDETVDLFMNMIAKTEMEGLKVETSSAQAPNYMLLWNRKLYVFTIAEATDEVVFGVKDQKSFKLNLFAEEFAQLKELSEHDLAELLEKQAWTHAKILKDTEPDFIFEVDGKEYRTWKAGYELLGGYAGESVATKLSKEDFTKLEQYVRELNIQ